MNARVGIGYDSHRFAPTSERTLVLAGVPIPSDRSLVGHSDADAIAHAVTDAVLGACAAGDIGAMFPDTDPANKGKDSIEILRQAVARIGSLGYTVTNVDVTVIAERPKVMPYRDAMRHSLAQALSVSVEAVSVKGKTNEGMGWIGRGEGIACMAVATVASIESARGPTS